MVFKLKRRIKRYNDAYVVLFVAMIFCAVMLALNWFIYDLPKGINPDELQVDRFERDKVSGYGELNWWNPLHWVGIISQWLSEQLGGVIDLLVLNVPLLNEMGYIGTLLRVLYGILITIGLIEIFWIG